MAYQVQSKQKQRRDARTLNLEGEKFAPRAITVGLDRDVLRPLRAKLAAAGDAYNEKLAFAQGWDADWQERLDPLPPAKKRREASAQAEALLDDVILARAELIAAALDKGHLDSVLTAEVLVEKLEIEDINAYSKLLFNEASPTLDDRPTGDSDAD